MDSDTIKRKIDDLKQKIKEKELQIVEANAIDCPYGFYSKIDKNKISVFGIYEKKSLTLDKNHWRMLIKFLTSDEFLNIVDD